MRGAGGQTPRLPEVAPSLCDGSRQPPRLDERMAKKRVHEIAKERGISSKEVIAVLQRAGLDVKAAAQSIDENDIAMAFGNGRSSEGGGQQTGAEGRGQKAEDGAPAAS